MTPPVPVLAAAAAVPRSLHDPLRAPGPDVLAAAGAAVLLWADAAATAVVIVVGLTLVE